jgi:Domain of unknown function (DUF4190)
MKKCLKCGQSYADDSLNFCLNDGEMLVANAEGFGPPTRYADDTPPTLILNQPRVTNPIDWGQSSPMQYQGQSPAATPPPYTLAAYGTTRNQTLPTVSLIFGIIACFAVCCVGGVWAGLPAAITGYIAMRNADNDPTRYGGRGMAITGLVLGIVTFLASVLFLIFGQLS